MNLLWLCYHLFLVQQLHPNSLDLSTSCNLTFYTQVSVQEIMWHLYAVSYNYLSLCPSLPLVLVFFTSWNNCLHTWGQTAWERAEMWWVLELLNREVWHGGVMVSYVWLQWVVSVAVVHYSWIIVDLNIAMILSLHWSQPLLRSYFIV